MPFVMQPPITIYHVMGGCVIVGIIYETVNILKNWWLFGSPFFNKTLQVCKGTVWMKHEPGGGGGLVYGLYKDLTHQSAIALNAYSVGAVWPKFGQRKKKIFQ